MPRRETSFSIAEKFRVVDDAAERPVVVITGASSGIGLSAALAMSRAGWRVICAVRNIEKMTQAVNKAGSIAPGVIESMKLDLASFDSVKAFASELLKREDVTKISALLLNAGLGTTTWQTTKDGYEYGFQSCHLAHHLLVRLLEDRLVESAPSRVVVVASHAHKSAPKTYDWPSAETGHKGFHSDSAKGFYGPIDYSASKMANMHFALVLSKRLQDKGVSVASLHPGVVNSALWPKWMVGRSLYMLNNDQGAATSVYLCMDPKFNDPAALPAGSYYAPSRFGLPHSEKPTKVAQDEKMAERLWEETELIVKQWLE